MKIIGAGMAGLLAANMLRKYEPEIWESQPSLPYNHGALLRFRTTLVAEASGQRFREVRVTKGFRWGSSVLAGPPPIPAVNLYSRKVTGRVLPRSVMSLEPSTRYIAPDDFTATLARGLRVELGKLVTLELIQRWAGEGETIISTIPMPVLMKIIGWGETGLRFEHQPIWSLRTRIVRPPTEVYQTIYYPEDEPWYRASITGDLLIIESLRDIGSAPADIPLDWIRLVLSDFGITESHHEFPTVHHQPFGKIAPCEDSERKAFILAMTDQLGIYSLGRFGTWRQILLDDLVQDIRIIDAMISERSIYNRHKSAMYHPTQRKGGLVP